MEEQTIFLTEKQVAERLAISVAKLQKDRRTGKSIKFHKLGRAVRYSTADVQAYLDKSGHTSTSQYGGRNVSI